MDYLIALSAVSLWIAFWWLQQKVRQNITLRVEQVKHTPESLRENFIEYWKGQMDQAPKEEKGNCLYRAYKSDELLNQIFNPKEPELTEEQIVEKSENIVPLRPI
jgi:hypothetical protein